MIFDIPNKFFTIKPFGISKAFSGNRRLSQRSPPKPLSLHPVCYSFHFLLPWSFSTVPFNSWYIKPITIPSLYPSTRIFFLCCLSDSNTYSLDLLPAIKVSQGFWDYEIQKITTIASIILHVMFYWGRAKFLEWKLWCLCLHLSLSMYESVCTYLCTYY